MAYQYPLNGGRINASIGGNSTSAGAGYSLISTGTMLLAGGNNITLSQNGSAISISAPPTSSVSATGIVSISNNGSTVSIGAPAYSAGISTLGNTSGTTGFATNQLLFAGGNNITLSQSTGAAGNTLTISAASQTNQSLGYYASGNTTGQSSSSTFDARSVSLSAAGGISAGFSGSALQLSAPAQSSISGTGIISISRNASTISIGAPAFSAGMSMLGNTAGTTGTVSNQIIFAGGNNVTLSQSTGAGGNTVTISAANQTNQNMSLYALGNTTQNSSTLLNASNLSFNGLGAATLGYSNGSIQVSVPTQTNQTANFYVSSNTTQLSSTAGIDLRSVSFQGAGIASVGVSQGKVLISVPGGGAGGVALANSQTTYTSGTVNLLEGGGAVTIASSAGGQSFKISVPTVSSLSATGAVSISNNAGTISIGAPAFSAGMSTLGNTAGTTGTVSNQLIFAGGNNITLSQSTGAGGNTISISAFNQSVQTQSNIQGIIASGSTNRTGDISFANSNGVTFGLSNNTITASVAGGAGGVALYDGANSISSGTARISAGGGLTASINGQTLSLSAPAQSSLSATGIFSISTNGSTISMGAAAYSAGISTNGNTSGTTGFATNQLLLAGGNNITLSQSTGAGGNTLTISAASQTNQSLGLYGVGNTTGQSSSSTFDARTLSFQGAGAASVGYSNGSVVISAPNAAAGNVTFSAGGNSAGLASIVFSNSNGVSFGLNGSTITASAAGGAGGGVALYDGANSITSGTASVSAGGALTASINGQTLSLNAPASSSIVGTGALNVSTNGSTISLGVPGLMSYHMHNSAGVYSSSSSAMVNASVSLVRMLIPQHLSFTRVEIPVTVSGSTSATANTAGWAFSSVGILYSRNGSTLNPIIGQSSNTTYSYYSNSTASFNGPRMVSFGLATTLSAGEYYFGVQISTATSSMGTATTAPALTFAPIYGTSYSAAPWQGLGSATNATINLYQPLQGMNSVTISNTSQTFQQSQITQSGATAIRANLVVLFRNN